MKEKQFRKLLHDDRREALRVLFAAWVEEWLNDGPEEIVRVLTFWAADRKSPIRLQLGSENLIVELARDRGLLKED